MKPIVIVDIDGTICDTSHRVHYLMKEPKDWESFFQPQEMEKDSDIPGMRRLLHCLRQEYDLMYVTGRPERTRESTLNWLIKYIMPITNWNGYPIDLRMRPDGNFTDDDVLKLEMISDLRHEDIAFVLEDRARIVAAYRAVGIRCFQVQAGDF